MIFEIIPCSWTQGHTSYSSDKKKFLLFTLDTLSRFSIGPCWPRLEAQMTLWWNDILSDILCGCLPKPSGKRLGVSVSNKPV